MNFVAIEYDDNINNTHVIGYLRIPQNFNPAWSFGYREYIKDTYSVTGDIKIYPLNVHLNSDTMGKPPFGYKNLEDDFNLALRSTEYYPTSAENDSIRRQWSLLDPASQDYCEKHR